MWTCPNKPRTIYHPPFYTNITLQFRLFTLGLRTVIIIIKIMFLLLTFISTKRDDRSRTTLCQRFSWFYWTRPSINCHSRFHRLAALRWQFSPFFPSYLRLIKIFKRQTCIRVFCCHTEHVYQESRFQDAPFSHKFFVTIQRQTDRQTAASWQ
jgi:hypothetical protein